MSASVYVCVSVCRGGREKEGKKWRKKAKKKKKEEEEIEGYVKRHMEILLSQLEIQIQM